MIEEFREFFIEGFNRYYGFDWLAMVLTLFSIHLLEKKNINGFVLGGFACVSWGIFNVLAGSLAGIIANLFFIFMYVKAFMNWRKQDIEEK